jgi:hypothetical protein
VVVRDWSEVGEERMAAAAAAVGELEDEGEIREVRVRVNTMKS